MEVDIIGAGDSLDKVDVKIRRLKETIRSIYARLTWKLANSRVKDLISYATYKKNEDTYDNSSTTSGIYRKEINYKKEHELSFGTYCEVLSNNAEQKSHRAMYRVIPSDECERIFDIPRICDCYEQLPATDQQASEG